MSNTTKEEIRVGDYVKILSNGGDFFQQTGLTIGEIRRVECVDKNPHQTYIYVSGIPGSANGRISNCGKYNWCLLDSEVEFVSRDGLFMAGGEYIHSHIPGTILSCSSTKWPSPPGYELGLVEEDKIKVESFWSKSTKHTFDSLIKSLDKIITGARKRKRKTILEDLEDLKNKK